LQQSGCTTHWVVNNASKTFNVSYHYHGNKVIKAYINAEEYLTVCMEGILNISSTQSPPQKNTTPQIFALQIPLKIEQLKQSSSSGIFYDIYGKVPIVTVKYNSLIPYCPELPQNARNVAIENSDTKIMNYSQQDLQKLYPKGFLEQNLPNPNQGALDTVYYIPLQQANNKEIAKEIIYVHRPTVKVFSAFSDNPIAESPPPTLRNPSPLAIQSLATPQIDQKETTLPPPHLLVEPIAIHNPSRFDGEHFLILQYNGKTEQVNHRNAFIFTVVFTVIIDILLLPVYLIGGIILGAFILLCSLSHGGCRM
jgi:hypothetical protein